MMGSPFDVNLRPGCGAIGPNMNIGRLTLRAEEHALVFGFQFPAEMSLEVPANIEQELSAAIARIPGGVGSRAVAIDLDGFAAISSRQLGMMLAIRKVCCPEAKVALLNVSQGVHDLLELTRMEVFFEY